MDKTVSELKEQIQQLEDWKKSARKAYFQEKIELLQKFKTKFGDDVDDIIDAYVRNDMLDTWQKISKDVATPDVDTLVQKLWIEMCAPGGIKFDVSKQDEITQLFVTKCPFVDMAKDLGMEEWGYQFYCMSDYAIVEGFNPDIEFTRTKTLMQGHECCDHAYRMREKDI